MFKRISLWQLVIAFLLVFGSVAFAFHGPSFSVGRLALALTFFAPMFGMAFMGAAEAATAIQKAGGDINAVMGGWKDRGPWTYYDNAIFAAGTALPSTISFFSIPLNQPDPNNGNALKNLVNTNGLFQNAMPSNRCLVLENIGIYFDSRMRKSDIDNLMANFYMEMKIEDKVYFQGPLWLWPSGLSLYGVSTQTGESAWNLGLPSPYAAKRYGRYSKYIAPLQPFTVQLINAGTTTVTPATSGPGLIMYVEMDGLTDRSVQ